LYFGASRCTGVEIRPGSTDACCEYPEGIFSAAVQIVEDVTSTAATINNFISLSPDPPINIFLNFRLSNYNRYINNGNHFFLFEKIDQAIDNKRLYCYLSMIMSHYNLHIRRNIIIFL
jgi:hypothetical protein